MRTFVFLVSKFATSIVPFVESVQKTFLATQSIANPSGLFTSSTNTFGSDPLYVNEDILWPVIDHRYCIVILHEVLKNRTCNVTPVSSSSGTIDVQSYWHLFENNRYGSTRIIRSREERHPQHRHALVYQKYVRVVLRYGYAVSTVTSETCVTYASELVLTSRDTRRIDWTQGRVSFAGEFLTAGKTVPVVTLPMNKTFVSLWRPDWSMNMSEKKYRVALTGVIQCSVIVTADSIETAIVDDVASNVVADTLVKTIAVVSFQAGTCVTTISQSHAMCVRMTLGWIYQAIGDYADIVDAIVTRTAVAGVTRCHPIVLALFVISTICVDTAFIWINLLR